MPTPAGLPPIPLDTTSPEVALVLIAHTLATREAWNPKKGRLDVDAYLQLFDTIYKRLKATTAPPIPTGVSA
jgi:hypothetical protein